MSIFTFFKRKKSKPKAPVDTSLRGRYAAALEPPFSVIGVASENGEVIASALAFVIHEACGWKVATIEPQYFAKTGVTAMLGVTSSVADPVLGVSLDEAVEVIETALEAKFPGIWLRCLDYAQSRLPRHILVVYGVETEEQAEWVRARGGKIVSDGTVPSLRGDITIIPDADNSYVGAATSIIDAYLFESEEK